MHPLTLLVAALWWNYVRHRRGGSTMCSATRRRVKPVVFVLGWCVLTVWLLPHYVRPFRKVNHED